MPDPCSICHVQIAAPDLDKAISFYTAVFGWKVEKVPSGNYAMWNDGALEGGFDPSEKVSPEPTDLYMQVPDIAAKIEEVEAAGGSLVQNKTEISGGFGFFAQVKDTNGVAVGIWCRE